MPRTETALRSGRAAPARDISQENHTEKTAEQGDTANIKQNTTNAGFSKAGLRPAREVKLMNDTQMNHIKEHMEIIGADGVHIGTVNKVEGNRIKLTKADSGEGQHKGHHHFIEKGLVAEVEGNKVRLSANAAVAVTMEEEKSSKSV
jgi:hypothetical protein